MLVSQVSPKLTTVVLHHPRLPRKQPLGRATSPTEVDHRSLKRLPPLQETATKGTSRSLNGSLDTTSFTSALSDTLSQKCNSRAALNVTLPAARWIVFQLVQTSALVSQVSPKLANQSLLRKPHAPTPSEVFSPECWCAARRLDNITMKSAHLHPTAFPSNAIGAKVMRAAPRETHISLAATAVVA